MVCAAFLLGLGVNVAWHSESPWSETAWGGSALLFALLGYLASRVACPAIALVVDGAGFEARSPWRRPGTVLAWDDVTKAEVVHVFRRGYGLKVHLTSAARERITGQPGASVTVFDVPDLDVPVNDIGLTPRTIAEVFSHYGGVKVSVPNA